MIPTRRKNEVQKQEKQKKGANVNLEGALEMD